MSMKVVGSEENLPSRWKRFGRLQRTAQKLHGPLVHSPRGVFRFSSFAEFEEWKRRQKPLARPTKTTSSLSAEH
jgi:hypothetical protein